MSDSLRDQLLKAGFAQPKPKNASRARTGHNKKKSGQHGGNKAQMHTAASERGNAPQTGTQPIAGHTHVPATPPKKKKAKKAPAVKSRTGTWSTRGAAQRENNPASPNTASGETARHNVSVSNIQQQQGSKGEIQVLIESTAIKQHKGDAVYRFTWQNKIRELLVTEKIRRQLANNELAVTWLNGRSWIIPADTAKSILNINAQWHVFSNEASHADDEDDDYPVPDDLIW